MGIEQFLKFKPSMPNPKQLNTTVITDELVIEKNYFIRRKKAMIDSDFSTLYLVETKRLTNRQAGILNGFRKILGFS